MSAVEKPILIRRPNFQTIWAKGERDIVSVDLDLTEAGDPFVADLKYGFKPCSVLSITGYIERTAGNINFTLEHESKTNVALKVEPRDSDGKITLSSRDNGAWSEKEIVGDAVLGRGLDFTLQIVCDVQKFIVYIHGKKTGQYFHRLAVDPIKKMCINGDIKLHKVLYQWRLERPTQNNLIEFAIPDQFRVVFARPLVKGFKPGSTLTIIGLINNDTDRMHVCLQSRAENQEEADLMFYYNPKFTRRKFVQRNVTDTNKDPFDTGFIREGQELPIKKFQEFTLQVNCEEDGFRSYVDGKEFIFFKHQICADDINEFKIVGKVKLFKVLYRWVPE